MEKKILTEINHMRKIMGLPLIVEAGPWADIIGKVIGTAAQKSDIDLIINRVAKKILVSDIDKILKKVVNPKQTLSGDEIDILKALDTEIKKPNNSLGKTNLDGLSGIYRSASNDAATVGDATKARLLNKQAKKIDDYVKSQGAGSISNTSGKVSSSVKDKLQGLLDSSSNTGGVVNKVASSDVIRDIINDQIGQGAIKIGKANIDEVVDAIVKSLDDNWTKNLTQIESAFGNLPVVKQRTIINKFIAEVEHSLPQNPKSRSLFNRLITGLNLFTQGGQSLPSTKNFIGALAGVYTITSIIGGVCYLVGADELNFRDGLKYSVLWPRTVYKSLMSLITPSPSKPSTPSSLPPSSDVNPPSRESPPPPKEGPTKMRQINPDLIR